MFGLWGKKTRPVNKHLRAVLWWQVSTSLAIRGKRLFDTLEKQRKWEYNGELKQPTAFIKTVITHSAVEISDKINT